MDKLDILKKATKLSDPQKDILHLIKLKCNIQKDILYACVYSSKFDGLGNKFSDLDVYVIVSDDKAYVKRLSFVLGNIPLDIEVISNKKINKILQKNKYDLTDGDIKRLWRIKISMPVFKSLEKLDGIAHFDIAKLVFDLSNEKSYELEDDGNKMFKVENFISSIECFRSSIIYSIKARGCLYDRVILKDKWLLYSFIKNGYNNQQLAKRVEQLLVFPCVSKNNISSYNNNLATLAENLLFINKLDFNRKEKR